MTTWSQVNDSDDESQSDLRATFNDFAEIVDEWRVEIADNKSAEDIGTVCATCGNKEGVKRQTQDLQSLIDKQLQLLGQFEEKASTLRRGIREVIERSRQHTDLMRSRTLLVERAVLGDDHAKDAITFIRVSSFVTSCILDATICTFFPDLFAVREDEIKKEQLKSLQSHINLDGLVDMKGFLQDFCYIEDVGCQTTGMDESRQRKEIPFKVMIERLQARIREHLDKYEHEAKLQNDLVETKTENISLLEVELERRKRKLRSSTLKQDDCPGPCSDELGDHITVSPDSEKEINLAESRIHAVRGELKKGHDELARLNPLILKLKKGWEFIEDDSMIDALTFDYPPDPRTYSQEYIDNMLSYAERTNHTTIAKLINILFKDMPREPISAV
ncbi:hypothetical protein ACEPAG_293 [Sanghuangporus baumii]